MVKRVGFDLNKSPTHQKKFTYFSHQHDNLKFLKKKNIFYTNRNHQFMQVSVNDEDVIKLLILSIPAKYVK